MIGIYVVSPDSVCYAPRVRPCDLPALGSLWETQHGASWLDDGTWTLLVERVWMDKGLPWVQGPVLGHGPARVREPIAVWSLLDTWCLVHGETYADDACAVELCRAACTRMLGVSCDEWVSVAAMAIVTFEALDAALYLRAAHSGDPAQERAALASASTLDKLRASSRDFDAATAVIWSGLKEAA